MIWRKFIEGTDTLELVDALTVEETTGVWFPLEPTEVEIQGVKYPIVKRDMTPDGGGGIIGRMVFSAVLTPANALTIGFYRGNNAMEPITLTHDFDAGTYEFDFYIYNFDGDWYTFWGLYRWGFASWEVNVYECIVTFVRAVQLDAPVVTLIQAEEEAYDTFNVQIPAYEGAQADISAVFSDGFNVVAPADTNGTATFIRRPTAFWARFSYTMNGKNSFEAEKRFAIDPNVDLPVRLPTVAKNNQIDWSRERTDRYEYFELERINGILNEFPLDGITGGELEWNMFSTLKTRGALRYAGDAEGWIDKLVRVYIVSKERDAVERRCLGTYMTTTPSIQVLGTNNEYAIDMYSSLIKMQELKARGPYTIAKGVNIVGHVKALLVAAGVEAVIIDNPTVLQAPKVWDAGVEFLQIANELLAMVNYGGLRVDPFGRALVMPYTDPQKRAPVFDFIEGKNGIYMPQFEFENDVFEVPNRVTVISEVNGRIYKGEAVNNSPASALSVQARGRYIDRVEEYSELNSDAKCKEKAQMLLNEAMLSVTSVYIEHSYVPISESDTVRFINGKMNLNRILTVASMRMELEAGGLTETRLRWYA